MWHWLKENAAGVTVLLGVIGGAATFAGWVLRQFTRAEVAAQVAKESQKLHEADTRLAQNVANLSETVAKHAVAIASMSAIPDTLEELREQNEKQTEMLTDLSKSVHFMRGRLNIVPRETA